jgi:hypothetical protein
MPERKPTRMRPTPAPSSCDYSHSELQPFHVGQTVDRPTRHSGRHARPCSRSRRHTCRRSQERFCSDTEGVIASLDVTWYVNDQTHPRPHFPPHFRARRSLDDRRRWVSMRGLTRPDARRCHPTTALRYQPQRNSRLGVRVPSPAPHSEPWIGQTSSCFTHRSEW